MLQALGLIEVRGLVGSIEASDAMVKAADVRLVGKIPVGGGLVTVMASGDVGAIKAAVDAGAEAACRVSEVISVSVIPKPHSDIEMLLPRPVYAELLISAEIRDVGSSGSSERPRKKECTPQKRTELDRLTVNELRKIARATAGVQIKGREISQATKAKLVEELLRAQQS